MFSRRLLTTIRTNVIKPYTTSEILNPNRELYKLIALQGSIDEYKYFIDTIKKTDKYKLKELYTDMNKLIDVNYHMMCKIYNILNVRNNIYFKINPSDIITIDKLQEKLIKDNIFEFQNKTKKQLITTDRNIFIIITKFAIDEGLMSLFNIMINLIEHSNIIKSSNDLINIYEYTFITLENRKLINDKFYHDVISKMDTEHTRA
jgi:hypothetical protein